MSIMSQSELWGDQSMTDSIVCLSLTFRHWSFAVRFFCLFVLFFLDLPLLLSSSCPIYLKNFKGTMRTSCNNMAGFQLALLESPCWYKNTIICPSICVIFGIFKNWLCEATYLKIIGGGGTKGFFTVLYIYMYIHIHTHTSCLLLHVFFGPLLRNARHKIIRDLA